MSLTPKEIILDFLSALQKDKDHKLLSSNCVCVCVGGEGEFYRIDINSRAFAKVLAAISGWFPSKSYWSLDIIMLFYLVIMANSVDLFYTKSVIHSLVS